MSLQPPFSLSLVLRTLGPLGLWATTYVASPALAALDIGWTTKINQSVTGTVGGRPYRMSESDKVKQKEVLRTDGSGEARLQFNEGTDLVIFSSSSITLDQFSTNRVEMSTSNGSFAFNTGHLSPGAYHIITSAGTLTPHGTRFTFVVHGAHLKLDVQEGAVTYCPRGQGPAACVDAVPGRSVVGQAGAPAQIQGPPGSSPPPAVRVGRAVDPQTYTPPTYTPPPAVRVVYPPMYTSPPAVRVVYPPTYFPPGACRWPGGGYGGGRYWSAGRSGCGMAPPSRPIVPVNSRWPRGGYGSLPYGQRGPGQWGGPAQWDRAVSRPQPSNSIDYPVR